MTLKEYIDQLQTEINLSDDEFDREEMGRVDGLRYALHLAKQISETESPHPQVDNNVKMEFDTHTYLEEFIKETYEPVEDKPGYVWFSKRNSQIVKIEVLAEALREGWIRSLSHSSLNNISNESQESEDKE
ncbi:MAG: hypothetical protein IKF42_06325 [Mogibacterium sp.]|nr:hypothetical protein [Mogibacterium sp.]